MDAHNPHDPDSRQALAAALARAKLERDIAVQEAGQLMDRLRQLNNQDSELANKNSELAELRKQLSEARQILRGIINAFAPTLGKWRRGRMLIDANRKLFDSAVQQIYLIR